MNNDHIQPKACINQSTKYGVTTKKVTAYKLVNNKIHGRYSMAHLLRYLKISLYNMALTLAYG